MATKQSVDGATVEYFQSNSYMTDYTAARNWCNSNGGVLAMPKNNHEREATSAHCDGTCWIGLTFKQNDGW